MKKLNRQFLCFPLNLCAKIMTADSDRQAARLESEAIRLESEAILPHLQLCRVTLH